MAGNTKMLLKIVLMGWVEKLMWYFVASLTILPSLMNEKIFLAVHKNYCLFRAISNHLFVIVIIPGISIFLKVNAAFNSGAAPA